MKQMRNNVIELLARHARRTNRKRIPIKTAAAEMNVSYYTLNAIVGNTIKEYPVEVLTKLCDYFSCNIGDILSYEEIPSENS
jgi:DNA-binding Xre family transcriptional regulator